MNEDFVDNICWTKMFYEVILHSQEYCDRLTIFYEESLVHFVTWRLLVEPQNTLKQECTIQVGVQCNQLIIM